MPYPPVSLVPLGPTSVLLVQVAHISMLPLVWLFAPVVLMLMVVIVVTVPWVVYLA